MEYIAAGTSTKKNKIRKNGGLDFWLLRKNGLRKTTLTLSR
ncbi:hypothetical protein ACE1TI_03855 [Alteribacillus sp. JSM 102045]